MEFKYNIEKNAKLLEERGIGFEEVIRAIKAGNMLDLKEHPNQEKYPNQRILYVRIIDEVYSVPFIREKDGTFFLKTAFPDRKIRKYFLGK